MKKYFSYLIVMVLIINVFSYGIGGKIAHADYPNVALGKHVQASHSLEYYEPENAVDDDPNYWTEWFAAYDDRPISESDPVWLMVDLGNTYDIYGWKATGLLYGGLNQLKSGYLEGSIDGINFFTIDAFSGNAALDPNGYSTTVRNTFLEPATYRYFRLKVTEVGEFNSALPFNGASVMDFALYGTPSSNPPPAADTTPPSVVYPEILHSNVMASTATLSWNAATDDETTVGDLQYLVYQSLLNNLDTVQKIETNGTPVGSYEANKLGVALSGLSPNTTYYYNVIVKDEAGNKFAYQPTHFTTKNKWAITYHDNGADSGAPPTDSNMYEDGDSAVVLGNSGSLMKSGHTFSGWTIYQDGSGPVYQDGDQLSDLQADILLYPKWIPISSYSISYDGNKFTSGDEPVDSTTYHQGASVIISDKGTLERSGYTFKEWNTSADGTGTGYEENESIHMPAENLILYAIWHSSNTNLSGISMNNLPLEGFSNEKLSYTETVPYDVSTIDIQVTVDDPDSSVTINGQPGAGGNILLNEGTNIISIVVTASDGSVKTYTVLIERHSLFFEINYDDNGATGGSVPSPEQRSTGQTVIVAENTGAILKEGHTFVGWNTEPDGSGTSYAAGEALLVQNTDVTLYAQWERNTHVVTINSNGGSNVSPITINHGDTLPADLSVVKAGHTFAGWFTDAGFTEAFSSDASIYSDTFLYAKWQINQYQIVFDFNYSNQSTDYMVVYHSILEEPIIPDRDQYVFSHWFTEESFLNPYDFSSLITGHLTLYAKWDYLIQFDSTGGSEIQSQVVAHGEKVTEPSSPEKTGHTFAGWYKNLTDTEPYNFDMHLDGPVQIFAKWIRNEYTVTFNSSEGSLIADGRVKYEDQLIKPPNPTRTGYEFIGWYTDEALTAEYSFSAPVSESFTLYAKWQVRSYTVTYDSDEGTSIPAETVNADNPFTEPPQPEKEGRTFAGWYTDETLTTKYEFTMKALKDITLYAKWDINSYKVTYDSNDGTEVSGETVEYNQVFTEPDQPEKEGHTFAGWYTDETLTTKYEFTMKALKDITLYAKWDINSYKVTYDSNDGTEVSGETVEYNQVFTEPEQPEKEGHTFAGWYTDEAFTTEYDFETKATSDLTLYAKWSRNEYTVAFDSNGGSAVDEAKVLYEDQVIRPQNPTREGYGFVGWYLDEDYETSYAFMTPVSTDFTLYAKWVINSYSVTFDSNGGTAISNETVGYNGVFTEPDQPEKEGHTFAGWYTDGTLTTKYEFTMKALKDITLYAKWDINSYKVTYDSNDGTEVSGETVEYNRVFTEPDQPEKTGHTFAGWYTDDTFTSGYDFETKATSDLTLYAKWSRNEYTVAFDSNGGSAVDEAKVLYEDQVSRPQNPTREGYGFVGWYLDEDYETSYAFMTPVTKDLTLYAKWNFNSYTVMYDVNGGTTISNETVGYNGVFTEPDQPEKEGHTFAGWYTDEALTTEYDFETKVTTDLTLYAKWSRNEYTVAFDSNGGSAVDEAKVLYEDQVSRPQNPTREGYGFVGWYLDEDYETSYAFMTPVSTDFTLYAKWAINSYSVTFDSNGGTNVPDETVEYNQVFTEPDQPEKAGYTFAGWYINKELTTAYDFTTKAEVDLMLYAKWNIKSYTVTYETEGGNKIAAETVRFNGVYTVPADPSKKGHTFLGWYTDEKLTKAYDFATKATTDITLYAKWDRNLYTVTFNSSGGSTVSDVKVFFENLLVKPQDPLRSGYIFDGWYIDQALTIPYLFTSQVIQDLSLFAKWNQVQGPEPEPNPDPDIEEIVIDVTDGNSGSIIVQTPIKRKTNEDGAKTDDVLLTVEKALEFSEASTSKLARIVIPDIDDEVIETNISIPVEALDILIQNNISVQIDMNGVIIDIPVSSLAGFEEDLYFRIVPVKDEKGKNEIEKRAKQEEKVKETAGSGATITVLGRPMTIETNLQSRPVVLTLPLPENLSLDQEETIAVFIEHSDGTIEVIKGTVIVLSDGQRAVQFEISKFSTFTLLTVETPFVPENPSSLPYVKGFEDGTFRPEADITRQQMATMLARQLTQNEIPSAGISPFSDLRRVWAMDEIEYVREAGIMIGHSATEFRPHDSVTRAQMATIAIRWIDKQCIEDNTYSLCTNLNDPLVFSDISGSHWASEMTSRISQLDIMIGYTDGTFRPNEMLTRAQAVKVLNRIFERFPEAGKASKFPDVPKDHWAYDEIMEAAH